MGFKHATYYDSNVFLLIQLRVLWVMFVDSVHLLVSTFKGMRICERCWACLISGFAGILIDQQLHISFS
jgi:hypothetical protein